MSAQAVIPERPPGEPRQRNFWRAAVAPYARPSVARSVLDLATSVVPYVALTVASYLLLDTVPYLVVLALALPTAGFLLRTYMVFHDCAHGSFLPSSRANTWLGTALGLLVWECFASWRHNHAVHHATAGDLDRRGVGDLETLTVAEFRAATPRRRLLYRLFRSPFVMFTIGPVFALMVQPRIVSKSTRPRIRRAVMATNVALLLLVGTLIWIVGPRAYLLVQMPAILLAGAAGVWLFYVQHQFEDAYWESGDRWNFADAALHGSSHLKLPKVLQFFTANIGLHHVHHLSARIPNYHLQRAHDELELFRDVPELSLRDGLRATRLKLWDPERGRLVTFAQARQTATPGPAAPPVERAD